MVELSTGLLQGTLLSIPDHDKKAITFLGVPYAAPPVGDLRFEDPQPLLPWEGVKMAVAEGTFNEVHCYNITMYLIM